MWKTKEIVELYRQRSETAISETAAKYGRYLVTVSYGITGNVSDAEECVNDAYHGAWNAIPPASPDNLKAFLMKLVRRISVDLLRKRTAKSAAEASCPSFLTSLKIVCRTTKHPEAELERAETVKLIEGFLDSLSDTARKIFVLRYWFMLPVDEISKRTGFSASKIKSSLLRSRAGLQRAIAEADANEKEWSKVNSNDLLDSIGDIDSRYLDCDKKAPQRYRKIVFAALSAAACVSIGTAVLLSGILLPIKNKKGALKSTDIPESSNIDAAKNETAYMPSDADGLFVDDPKSAAARIFIYYPQNGVLRHDDPVAAGGCSDIFKKMVRKGRACR